MRSLRKIISVLRYKCTLTSKTKVRRPYDGHYLVTNYCLHQSNSVLERNRAAFILNRIKFNEDGEKPLFQVWYELVKFNSKRKPKNAIWKNDWNLETCCQDGLRYFQAYEGWFSLNRKRT